MYSTNYKILLISVIGMVMKMMMNLDYVICNRSRIYNGVIQ